MPKIVQVIALGQKGIWTFPYRGRLFLPTVTLSFGEKPEEGAKKALREFGMRAQMFGLYHTSRAEFFYTAYSLYLKPDTSLALQEIPVDMVGRYMRVDSRVYDHIQIHFHRSQA